MFIKSDGIVLRVQYTGERDKLITVLTRENGVIRAFVNGARNPKNKNNSATEQLCFSDFNIYKSDKGVYSIREASPKETFFSLRYDIIRLSLAQYFAQLAYELGPREENADEYLRIVLNAIYLLCEGKRKFNLIKSAVELRLMSLAGYMPSIVACCKCGTYESQQMYFCIENGQLYCDKCSHDPGSRKISLGVVTAMRHICFSEPEKVFNFNLAPDSGDELGFICEQSIKLNTKCNYDTLKFYKKMI